ncbi:hypothetical protein LCGC14_3133730 [marine sediment metagenome]|uniref:Uncharacterized protein n=1 Tax=marine sediment metagenome TaxID=412755 RepID=A0A0F8WMU2_9ZZZZ
MTKLKVTANHCSEGIPLTEVELCEADVALAERVWMMREHAGSAMSVFDKLFCNAVLGDSYESG